MWKIFTSAGNRTHDRTHDRPLPTEPQRLNHVCFLQAIENEEKMQIAGERLAKLDDRKRPYNSMFDVKAPTEAEIEAYYLKQKRAEDPMADFL